ncbi:MAG: DUF389 domain-containing protein [Methylococcales bacterium]|nr:DUF389 domain-containing protein [Methylococcales bacterium]
MNPTETTTDTRLLEIQAARADITLNAQFDKAFIIMNALAAIIASYGLLADSASGVIGAMLVALLLSPIAGVSLALVDGNNKLLKQSLLSLGGGIGIVMLCALVIGLFHADIPAGKELLARTHPNYLDLMIALAGGAVGAYAVITPRIVNAVVGVAIATALVPPLCTGTIFAARGEWDNALGAYLLTFANIVAIQFAFSVVLWLCGFHKAMDSFYRDKKIVWLNGISLALLVFLFVVLGANTNKLVANMLFEANTRKVLVEQLKPYPGCKLLNLSIGKGDGVTIVRALVHSPFDFTAPDVAKLEALLPASPNGLPIELHLRHVKVNVMTKKGSRYDLSAGDKPELLNSP